MVRNALEILAARLAIERISPEQIGQVHVLEVAHAREASGGDVRGLMRVNDQFHDAIYGAAGNSCLLETIQQLRRQIHPVRFNAWARPERIARSVAEHRQMVEALSHHDEDGLARLTKEHLRVAKESYLFHLGVLPAPTTGRETREPLAGSIAGNAMEQGPE